MKLIENGLVLVGIPELMQVPFKHLVTSLDEDKDNSLSNCGRAATITGYTEWFSETQPYLTVGWDWVIDERAQGSAPWRLGSPRTNVNLVGNDGRALPWEASLEKLGQLMDALLPWQQTVHAFEVPQPVAQNRASSPAENIL
ncbi:DUF4902 domain-containing protein [Curvibacter sp. AEP1-3]|uniref:DUF4902 domain-containing protein n=1 Tax=Curvibacter sp. AEP1-3 TaxID=1844971 RepID=UPI0012FBD8C7|nr:DUF4902 domain-containing protein [Curvibacter sp. AEP1-3]